MRQRLHEFFLGSYRLLQAVRNCDCANLRSLAVPLRRLRERLACCARGGCKRSETAMARIYVCSLCRLAVARERLREIFLGLLCPGRLQAVRNCDCMNLRSLAAVPLGGCANACVSFSLACCARGGCKRSETAIARIYVPTCCCSMWHREKRAVLPTHTWILTVGYSRVLTCSCVLTLVLALANWHLDTYTWILALAHSHLDTDTWILKLDTC